MARAEGSAGFLQWTCSQNPAALRVANLPRAAAAVTLPPEHSLILAGAGSGKTRVLTTRIAWLLSTGQIGPGNVLAVTFTNKAAKEMMVRLQAMLPVNVRGMWIGTFHGLCNRFLRAIQVAGRADFPDPRHAGPAVRMKR